MNKSQPLPYKLVMLALSLFIILSLAACGGGTKATPVPEDADPNADFSNFKWPNSELAKLIPTPGSNFGYIHWEASYGFVIDVGNTSKGEYDKYVDECWDRGFVHDYNKGNDFFWANNESGHKVSVRYDDEYNVMWIRMDAAKEDEIESTPDPKPEQTIDTQTDSQTDGSTEAPIASNVDWKEFLRLYEEWIDSYIELLEKYNENPTDITILNDYLNMMIELAEWAEMAEEIEVDLANDPTALKEYLETLSRIILKLSEVEI